MQTGWICSSTFLPYTGEPIDFLLEDREQPIHGYFANGLFQSRWADYDANRVRSWCHANGDPSAEQIVIPEVAAGGEIITTLKRLAQILFSGRSKASAKSQHCHSRATG